MLTRKAMYTMENVDPNWYEIMVYLEDVCGGDVCVCGERERDAMIYYGAMECCGDDASLSLLS